MPETTFLLEISLIFILATVASAILSKFKQPLIAAHILTGIILGPHVLGLVNNMKAIHQLSEIGVIALLFTLGLEFSFDKFNKVKDIAILSGISQILLTILTVFVVAKLCSFNTAQCFLLGCIVALSSTIIVLKSLTDCAQLESIHGRIILGMLIIQDLSLIPIMIILPQINSSGDIFIPLLFALLKAGVFLLLAILASIKFIPFVMNFIASTSKEALILSSVGIALSTAIVASKFGVSLALGAFIAGLSLSITAHSKQVIAEIIPFRDVFAMVFFVSIGMLMDLQYFMANIISVMLIVAGIIFIKSIICFMVVYFARYPGQTSLWTALSMFQIGEFSFILAQMGRDEDIISSDLYSLIIISSLITMLLTPFVIRSIPDIVYKLNSIKLWNKYFRGKVKVLTEDSAIKGHVIICGYGPIGRNIAKILKLNCEKFLVIELNNKTVKELKAKKIPVIYGDATHKSILKHAGVETARVLVITLPDNKSAEITISNARKQSEDLYIIVRARYQNEIDKLYQAGANIVIYEEYETSISFIDNVLFHLDYNCEEIESVSQLIRANKCQLLQEGYRKQDFASGRMSIFLNNEIEWVKVLAKSQFIGKQIKETNLRTLTGASIVSIIKKNKNIPNPSPETVIERGDILIALGSTEQLKILRDIVN